MTALLVSKSIDDRDTLPGTLEISIEVLDLHQAGFEIPRRQQDGAARPGRLGQLEGLHNVLRVVHPGRVDGEDISGAGNGWLYAGGCHKGADHQRQRSQ